MEKIEIPLVFDGVSNVFTSNERDFFHCEVFNRRIPIPLQLFKPLLSVHTLEDIPNLDWFIFPIIIDEPYFILPPLAQPSNPKYGFWSLIPDKIIESLRNNKGWIFIDICLEPVQNGILESISQKFNEENEFPSNRVIFNHFPRVLKNSFLSLPTWTEIEFIYRKDMIKSVPQDFLVNFRRDKSNQKLDKKKFCLFNHRWWKHDGATFIHDAIVNKLDLEKYGHISYDKPTSSLLSFYQQLKTKYPEWKISDFYTNLKESNNIFDDEQDLYLASLQSDYCIVIEAYYESYTFSYPFITEKIMRTIKARKPFVLIGQQKSLDTFHSYGYKSFHPHIDESYDSCRDSFRAISAFSEILKLLNKSKSEMKEMNQSLQPIFDHNIANFDKRVFALYNVFVLLKNDIRPY